MNKSNYHYPSSPEDCCCYCPSKKDNAPKGGRGAKYAESSANEDDEDDDGCGNQTYTKIDKTFAPEEVFHNLLDLIDDQMMSTMSALRKKARKFMKSELEQSFSSDTTNRRGCNCSDDNRSKGTSVVKKANEIDYQPQSVFLKKMVHQYQFKQNDYSDFNDAESPAMAEKCAKLRNKEQNLSRVQTPPNANQKKRLGSCCCKCHENRSPDDEQEHSHKKSEHVSRYKKKTKCRGNRKRRSGGNCESADRFEPDLKQPHENSCERCWKFASPSRSPVNKPEQRYDPNFRRGHSCMSLDAGKAENISVEKDTSTSPCKNLQSNLVTPDTARNVTVTLTSKRKPKVSMPDRSFQMQDLPCEDYSPQFTPLSKGPLRSQSYEHSKPCSEVRGFDFEYPSLWSAEALQTTQQHKCTPRPHSSDKVKERNSLEKGIIYSSKVRNLLTRPQNYIPATCNNAEEERYGSQQFRDVCGRGRLQNLDPCMKRNIPAKKEDPCQEMDISIQRGDNSRGSGFGHGLENGLGNGLENGLGNGLGNGLENNLENGLGNGLGSGLGTGGNNFDNPPQSDIPIDLDGALNDPSQKDASGKKSKGGGADNGKDKDKSSSKKPSSANKSPKSRSPSKTPKESPRGSKDRKGDKKGTCSTHEAQAYFKIPGEQKLPEKCGVSHPIQKCRCYPRVIDENEDDDDFCCHCDWQKNANKKSERVIFNEVDNPRTNEDYCSPRSAFPEPSTSQGRRPCPSPNYTCNPKSPLPNIDEYPEQLFDLSMTQGNYTEMVLPCPYRSYMNSRPLNNNVDANESRCQRSNLSPGNGNCSFRGSLNTAFLDENVADMEGNVNCQGFGNGNATFLSYNASSQVNANYGMEYPRKYCVMYMTKGKENTGDDVEVLVEELSQPCPNVKDGRMTNVSEKMTRMFKCPTESMALRFQKGVSDTKGSAPQKSRVLYF